MNMTSSPNKDHQTSSINSSLNNLSSRVETCDDSAPNKIHEDTRIRIKYESDFYISTMPKISHGMPTTKDLKGEVL